MKTVGSGVRMLDPRGLDRLSQRMETGWQGLQGQEAHEAVEGRGECIRSLSVPGTSEGS